MKSLFDIIKEDVFQEALKVNKSSNIEHSIDELVDDVIFTIAHIFNPNVKNLSDFKDLLLSQSTLHRPIDAWDKLSNLKRYTHKFIKEGQYKSFDIHASEKSKEFFKDSDNKLIDTIDGHKIKFDGINLTSSRLLDWICDPIYWVKFDEDDNRIYVASGSNENPRYEITLTFST